MEDHKLRFYPIALLMFDALMMILQPSKMFVYQFCKNREGAESLQLHLNCIKEKELHIEQNSI